jgi:hypothetical protein
VVRVRFAEAFGSEVTNVRTSDWFSTSFRTARERFVEAARAAGGLLECIPNPHCGPDGDQLSMDIALIGSTDAARTLVVSSGTHGVEGFAGSGIQTGLLREGIGSRLPEGVSILMIHAINPYGMAHLRRATEDNVDLNRNFRNHSGPHPVNLPYEALAEVIAPRSLSFWSEVRSWSRLLWYQLTAGRAASQAAVSEGQYSDPRGLFYGGTFDTWSNTTVRSVVRRYLLHATRVVLVDIHTGLGESGAAEVILNVPETSPEYERAVAIWGQRVETTVTGSSVSTHLEASLKLAIPQMLPKTEVTPVSLEFGTSSPMEVFRAVRAENWLHHHAGPEHRRARELKARLLRAFYPDTEEWRTSVWNQGNEVIERALANLARQTPPTSFGFARKRT